MAKIAGVDTVKVAVYTRVSTDKEEQKLSFSTQRDYYTKYCADRNYDLYNIYADEGITGTKRNRKQFLNMLIDAGLDEVRNKSNAIVSFELSNRKPKFKYIIMKDISRFSRNINIFDTVRALVEKKVYLIFENMNLTTEKDDWETEFGFYMIFSQRESKDKSEKLRWAYDRRKESGKWHMSNPLFGYDYEEKSDTYIINHSEARWVKKAFELYVNESQGTKAIAQYLNTAGVKTRKGNPWRADGVRRMITNEKYAGKVIIGKFKNADVTSENKTKVKVDPSEWEIIENGIDSIIDERVFEKAQEILAGRVKKVVTKENEEKLVGTKIIKSMFYKKIKCSKCGSIFTRVKGTKMIKGEKVDQYNYYCSNRRLNGKQFCDMRGVSQNVLIREMQKMIDERIINNLILKTSGEENSHGKEQSLFDSILNEIEQERAEADVKTGEIQEQIDELSTKISSLFENFISSNTSDMMKTLTEKQIAEYGEQQKELEAKKLQYSTAALDQKERYIRSYYESMQHLAKKKSYTVEELIEWIERIEVHEGKHLKFCFKFPSITRIQYTDNTFNDDALVYTKFSVRY